RLTKFRIEPCFQTLVAHVEDLERYFPPRCQPLPYRNLVLDWVSCQNCEHKPILEVEDQLLNSSRPKHGGRPFNTRQLPGPHVALNQYGNGQEETDDPAQD